MSQTYEHITVKEHPELSVIIVSYNTCELTLRAVGSVLDQEGTALEVIVVDNASSDGSVKALTKEFPQVRLLAQTQNLGFAQACNLAAGAARGRFFLLLNPDAYPLPGALAAILNFAIRRPDAKIWGGRALHPNGKLNPRSCARRPTLWSVISQSAGLASLIPHSDFFNSEAMPSWDRDEERCVDIVIGHFFLIGRNDWFELDGFDPSYFMYGEDVDLCLRAVDVGARPAITHKAEVVHEEGASQSHISRSAQILAARIRYSGRHLPKHHRFIAVWAIRLGVILRLLAYGATCLFPQHRGQHHRLRQIWEMRELWWNGYPDRVGSVVVQNTGYNF